MQLYTEEIDTSNLKPVIPENRLGNTSQLTLWQYYDLVTKTEQQQHKEKRKL